MRGSAFKFNGVNVKPLCRPIKFYHIYLGTPFFYGSFSAQWHFPAEKGLGPLVSVRGNLNSRVKVRIKDQ